MVMLQEVRNEKGRMRIEGLRERNKDRTARFLNARNRTIGVDKAYLDKQVEEKQMAKVAEQQAIVEEAAYNKKLADNLQEIEAAEYEAKEKENRDLRKALHAQMMQPKNNAIKQGPVDVDSCGSSSMQKFSGEDCEFHARKKLQQDQIRTWCSQQIAENKIKAKKEKEERFQYACNIAAQDGMGLKLIEEESIAHSNLNRAFQADNLARCQEIKRQQEENKRTELERDVELLTHTLKNDSFLNEEVHVTKSALASHRVRPDHFKGLDKDQIAKIYEENQAVLAQKEEVKQREAEEERKWSAQQEALQRAMDYTEEQSFRHRKEADRVLAETLRRQKMELKSKQEQMKRARFGVIEDGFFQGFGTSCR